MSKGNKGRDSNNTNRSVRSSTNSTKTIVKMTKERAQAIQSHADKFNTNQDFKSRAMSAADKNEEKKDEMDN